MDIASTSSLLSPTLASLATLETQSIFPDLIFKILGISVGVGVISILGYIANIQQGLSSLKLLINSLIKWWSVKIPSKRIFEHLSDNKTEIKIFVRDFFIQNGTPLYSREGLNGPVGIVPNVNELWPRVEGLGLSYLLNTLGQLDKTDNIEIIEMGKDFGVWDKNLIILGAQTQKCFDFYQKMNEVAYKVTPNDIVKISNNYKIKRSKGYGYGIILKSRNPFIKNGKAFLIGGYGVLGTEAATYYFSKHISELGRKFGNKSFGVVIRASISAGVQSSERLKRYDVCF